MKKIILKVIHQNWGLIGPGDWENKEWKIYNDLSVEIKIIYRPNESIILKNKISKITYNKLLKNINSSKEDKSSVNALDGSAWEFIEYNENKEIWKRDLGYIYGIEPLEKIGEILEKLIK